MFYFRGQFNNGGDSKTRGVQKGYANSSTSGRNKSKNLFVEETFNASDGWVDPKISQTSSGKSSRKKATKRNSTKNSVSKSKNETNKLNSSDWVEPKSCASMPKDAGKRRVQASGQSAGHWYTGSDGRKVSEKKSENCYVFSWLNLFIFLVLLDAGHKKLLELICYIV